MKPIEFMPCRGAHVGYITPMPVQTEEYSAMLASVGQELIERSMGLTAWHGTRCLGMAGVCQIWPGRAEAWILLGEGAGAFMRPIVRKALYVLDNYPAKRIELVAKTTNVEGNKLARLLGFQSCVLLEAYHPDGSDVFMYARIRK